jgi:ferritin-like metal-binding protein YciE
LHSTPATDRGSSVLEQASSDARSGGNDRAVGARAAPAPRRALHCGLEQRFLDLARNVAPYFYRRVAKQIGKVFLSIDHSRSHLHQGYQIYRDLVAGLKAHLEETNKQVERLQNVFEKLGKEVSGTQCPAIDGIIKEADEIAGEIDDKAVLDAAFVAAAQAVEHYQICRYGTLIAWAEELGHDEIVRFLTTNLNEENAANTKLNTVALRKGVNAKASTAA